MKPKIYTSGNPLIGILFFLLLIIVVVLIFFLPLVGLALAIPAAAIGAVYRFFKKKKEVSFPPTYSRELSDHDIIEGEFTEIEKKTEADGK